MPCAYEQGKLDLVGHFKNLKGPEVRRKVCERSWKGEVGVGMEGRYNQDILYTCFKE